MITKILLDTKECCAKALDTTLIKKKDTKIKYNGKKYS